MNEEASLQNSHFLQTTKLHKHLSTNKCNSTKTSEACILLRIQQVYYRYYHKTTESKRRGCNGFQNAKFKAKHM